MLVCLKGNAKKVKLRESKARRPRARVGSKSSGIHGSWGFRDSPGLGVADRKLRDVMIVSAQSVLSLHMRYVDRWTTNGLAQAADDIGRRHSVTTFAISACDPAWHLRLH